MKDLLLSIANTLRDVFAEKNSLDGFEDWDKLIGCVMLLEQLANSVDENQKESEVVNDG